jgi:LytS/YehU family sensor histidine kinase
MIKKYKISPYTLACICVWLAWIVITFTARIHYLKNPEEVFSIWLMVVSLQGFNGFWASLLLFAFYKRLLKTEMTIYLKFIIVVIISYVFSLGLACINYPIYTYMFDLKPIIPTFKKYLVLAFSKYFVTLLLSILYLLITYLIELRSQKEKTLTAIALANEAQLQMLRYQLNPHFLFNALNSIRTLVHEDILKADQMITDLSEFLRYSLSNEGSNEVSLKEEIEIIKVYLQIQKTRFEEKLEVDIDIKKDALKLKIPCFLIHPLVENAVKYGLETSPPPLRIQVTGEINLNTLIISVKNSGRLCKPVDSDCNGTGLKNVQMRLNHIFPESSSFELREKSQEVNAVIKIKLSTVKNEQIN